MTKQLIVVGALMAVGAMGQGVTTWGGLRFGMTEKQAHLFLGSKMTPTPGPDGQPSKPSSFFNGGCIKDVSSVSGFGGDACLFFDKTTKTLSLITLSLKPLKQSSDEEKVTAYSHLTDDLVKKYGPPVSIKGFSTIFRSGGQSVDIFAALSSEEVPLMLHIAYEATDTDKGL